MTNIRNYLHAGNADDEKNAPETTLESGLIWPYKFEITICKKILGWGHAITVKKIFFRNSINTDTLLNILNLIWKDVQSDTYASHIERLASHNRLKKWKTIENVIEIL